MPRTSEPDCWPSCCCVWSTVAVWTSCCCVPSVVAVVVWPVCPPLNIDNISSSKYFYEWESKNKYYLCPIHILWFAKVDPYSTLKTQNNIIDEEWEKFNEEVTELFNSPLFDNKNFAINFINALNL